MEIKQIRLRNLLALAAKYRLIAEFCDKIDMQPSYFSQIKRGDKALGNDRARRTEELMELPRGWMDQVHEAEPSQDSEQPAQLPERSAMSLAYVIEELPPVIREKIKGLIYSLSVEIGERRIQNPPAGISSEGFGPTSAKGEAMRPFQIDVGENRSDKNSKTTGKQDSATQFGASHDRQATG